MTRLRTLRIHRFRWVTPGTELTFADGVNLILGRNGTGKTTLLELLAAVWSGDFSAYREESFDVEAEFGLGETGWVRMRVENQRVGREEGLDAGADTISHLGLGPESNWEWSVTVEGEGGFADTLDRMIVLANRRTLHLNGNLLPNGVLTLNPFSGSHVLVIAYVVSWLREAESRALTMNEFLSRLSALPDAVLHMSQRRFPEDGTWLKSATEFKIPRNQLSLEVDEMPVLRIPGRVHLEGLVNSITARLKQSKDLPTILTFDRATLPSLGRIADTLSMANVELTLSLRVGEAPLDPGQGRPFSYEEPTFHFTKRDGSRLPLKSLSYGQKRLFAFLLYVDSSPKVIIADELANGLHYAMLEEEVLKLISDRQCFLAMQDPLILDHVLLESPEHVQRAIVTCTIVPEGARDRWRWSQPTPEEAADLFGAFQVGIQHTSEILKTRGLW